MSSMLLGLLLAASTVAVHVDPAEDVPEELEQSLARSLVKVIQEQTGLRAVLEGPGWPSCGQTSACASEVAARASAEQVIFVRVVHGATLLRVVLKLPLPDGTVRSAQADVTGTAEDTWDLALGRAAVELLGAGPRLIPDAELEAPPPSSSFPALPVALVSFGAASVGVGIGLGVASLGTQRGFDGAVSNGSDISGIRGEKRAEAWGANGLFIAGGLSLLAGAAIWLFSADSAP